MVIHIGNLIPIILVFQSLIFALVLYTDNGKKRRANFLLATFFLILGFQFFGLVAPTLGVNSSFFELMACVYGFAYGPLLYNYTRALIYKNWGFDYTQLLHWVPFGVLVVFTFFKTSVCGYAGFLMYLSLTVYISISIKKMMGYRQVLKQVQSQEGQITLRWLQYFMIFFCAILLLDILDQFIVGLDVVRGVSSIHLMLLFLVNWMFYKGLKQPQIFLGISKEDIDILQYKDKDSVPKTPDGEEREDLNKLETFMKVSKIYTDPTLTINDLARTVAIPARRLSFLINAFLDKNFIGYINHYRIEMAKERLKNPKEHGETISEIMYEVGFSSKSSFNAFFKSQTGMTPSEFKNSK